MPTIRQRVLEWKVWRQTHFAECFQNPSSPNVEIRDDGSRMVRTIWVHWDDVQQASVDFVGFPTVASNGDSKWVQRLLPHQHEKWVNGRNKKYFVCTQVMSVEPVGVPDRESDGTAVTVDWQGHPIYALGKMTLLYEDVPYELLEDNEILVNGVPDESTLKRYVTPGGEPKTEIVPVPQGRFLYVGAIPNVVPGQPGKRFGVQDIEFIWERVPKEAIGMRSVNPTASSFPIDDLLGKVNNANFPTGTSAFREGTLLLVGAKPRPIRSGLGDRLYNLHYRFLFKDIKRSAVNVPISHQYLLNRDGIFYEVTTDGTSNLSTKTDGLSLYDWGNFAELFRPV